MCGIWGLITKRQTGFTTKELEVAKQMMILTAIRGDHSTGFFSIFANKLKEAPFFWKQVGDPYNFLHQPKVRKPVEDAWIKNGKAIIGHGRLATVGSISNENAHPFQEGDITLVHNGNMGNGLDEFKDASTTVDSHALTKGINEVGVKQALGKSFGAYAIIFHDKASGLLFIARNDQRPLHMVRWYDDVMLIMSEAEALEYLCARNKIPAKEVLTFAPEVVYSLDMNTLDLAKDVDLKEERLKKQRAAYTPPMPQQVYPPWNHQGYHGNNSNTSNSKNVNNEPAKTPTKRKSLHFEVINKAPAKIGRDFKYECLSDENLLCYFLTSEDKPELIGKKGFGKINNVTMTDDNDYKYFIKYRLISWDAERDEAIKNIITPNENLNAKVKEYGTTFDNAGAGGAQRETFPDGEHLVLLKGGRPYNKLGFVELCQTQKCAGCKDTVDWQEHEHSFVDRRNRLFCSGCCDTWLLSHEANSLENLSETNL